MESKCNAESASGTGRAAEHVTARAAADELFMREALAEARLAAEEGEVPIGAVVVFDGEVIARAHNRREAEHNPSAHAEFTAMTAAAQVLGRWRLTGCTVYVTLEPCLMCAGLMVNARIDRCVYGASDAKGGAAGSLFDVHADCRLNHAFDLTAGVLAEECASVLRGFFARARHERSDAETDARAAERAALQEELHQLEGRNGERGARQGLCSAAASGQAAPHVVLAVDSFKGSVSSFEAEKVIAHGVQSIARGAKTTICPVADGGEGTIEAVCYARGGILRELEVAAPLGQRVQAQYLLIEDGEAPVAVVESAEAIGITYSPCTPDAALASSTWGVGELVVDAVQAGARTIYIGLGGSATNDGGAGFLQALGAEFAAEDGAPVPTGLAGLGHIARIDLAPALERLQGAELVALSDVKNPLVGARGSLAVFGPQKGLAMDGRHLVELDASMIAYARLLDTASRELAPRAYRSLASVPGAGAAGGLGAAVLALGGTLVSGIEAVLDLIGFDEAVADADLVITGEGMMDAQTASGKTPVGVARRAKRLGLPVIALVGGRAHDLHPVYRAGVDLVLPILREPMSLARALEPAEALENLELAGEAAIRAYLLGKVRPGA